jgi:hypothetical protein
MNLPREDFIAQLAIPFHVHCLKLWSRRASAPPYSVARCCFELIGITNGTVSLRAHDFAVIARPVIDELYRTTPQGQRPDANDLAARLYDALHAAGADVAIKQPMPPNSLIT